MLNFQADNTSKHNFQRLFSQFGEFATTTQFDTGVARYRGTLWARNHELAIVPRGLPLCA